MFWKPLHTTQKKTFVFVLALLALIGGCVSIAILLSARCTWLNIAPTAPVYPGAIVLRQVSDGVGTSRPIITNQYASLDAPEKIIAFYEEQGSCDEGNEAMRSRELCRGEATPFGEYFVYVDLDSFASKGSTSFAIEIRWHGCSSDLK